ncbi:hypothetical protein SLU01_22540 [Sporosarcina luteola]|uniref:Uncharacterized protein n=1 Tax=Sporosarcina luteola TaxID=582850 RepID=A0A511Z919_9BACL|nr:hypothetical protein SLU01_22540 [Sporosarcina luteola]
MAAFRRADGGECLVQRSQNDDNFLEVTDKVVKLTDNSLKVTDNYVALTDNFSKL